MELKEVREEARRAAREILELMPVGFTLSDVNVQKRIRRGTAKVDIDPGSDGGPSFSLVMSMQGLKEETWRDQIYSRVMHEIFHVRIWHQDKAVEDAVEELIEASAEAVETLAKAIHKSRDRSL